MPCLPTSAYRAPLPFRGGHIQTVAPVLLRKIPTPALRRETLETPDDDFFEVDFAESGGAGTWPYCHTGWRTIPDAAICSACAGFCGIWAWIAPCATFGAAAVHHRRPFPELYRCAA